MPAKPFVHVTYERYATVAEYQAAIRAHGDRADVDFLDGIIRAQIDRLTPWSATDAVFHWTRPADVANDQIHVTIAATARAVIAPYIRLAAELGAASIAVSTINQDEPAAVPITVFEQRSRAAIERSSSRCRSTCAIVFFSTRAPTG